MKILLILTLLIISINNTFAENAITLNKGDITPFSGILVKSEKMKELTKSDKLVPLLKAKFEAQNDLIEYHRETSREARSKLLGEQINGNMKGIYGFLTGVLVMSITFKITQEINR